VIVLKIKWRVELIICGYKCIRLDDFDFVEEVTGDNTGTLTGIGASHETKSPRALSQWVLP